MSRELSGIWLLLILWFSLLLCFYSLRRKNVQRLLLTVPVACVSYYLLQIVGGDYGVQVSPWVLACVCGICTIVIVYGIISEYRWQQTHLSERSVKYAVDALPTGICCYDADGRMLLKNKRMESLHRKLTGGALLNGTSFEALLYNAETPFLRAGENVVVIFSDQEICEFCKQELDDPKRNTGGKQVYVLTAADITEEYQKTQTLLEKQQTMTELNQRLREYNKEILSVITAREVLNAKVKIHDELGTSLLRVKKYLTDTQADQTLSGKQKREQEQQEILSSLQKNLTFLQREPNPDEVDEYTLLLQTAKQLDVRIEITGLLPMQEELRNICVTALHECLTNTLRHAQGNLLRVSFMEDERQVQALYTNNGTPPAGEIVEKGGLKSLRKLVERSGGVMEIRAAGGFELKIILWKDNLVRNNLRQAIP